MNLKPAVISGYTWALASTACLGTVYVFSKSALGSLSQATFLPLWFLTGTIAAFVYLVLSGRVRAVLSALIVWKLILVIGLLESIAMFAFFLEIELIDPTLVSFFNNMTTVYQVMFGVIFLKERLTHVELGGMGLVLFGASIITYRAGKVVLVAFLLAIFVHTLFRALSYLIAKPVAAQIGSEVLLGFRNLVMFLSAAAFALILARDQLQPPSIYAAGMTIAGALLGPFVGMMLFYRAVSLIDLAKVGIIQGSVPVFTLASAFIVFGTLPSPYQILGGALTIGGVYALYSGRMRSRTESPGAQRRLL
jgi:drug/metabolite transporter (DMT)-like permease